LTACGAHDTVVVRVGPDIVTDAALAHWISVMAPRHVAPDPPRYLSCIARRKTLQPGSADAELKQACRQQYQQLKRQALELLISGNWLVGEAAEQGLKVSSGETDERLSAVERSFGGSAQFQESQKAISRTIADLKLEIDAQLAAEKIRRMLMHEEPKVTRTQIRGYYEHNVKRYDVPERREFSIVENLKSKALARRLAKEFSHGKSIADMSLHESSDRPAGLRHARPIIKAIFAAQLNVISEPIEINHFYFLVKVTRITPAFRKTLSEVESAIEKKLIAPRRRRTLVAFVEGWRRKWTARTNCSPGYVVQKCRQYRGARTPEAPLAFN
jgi:foldase protein PrsA